MALPPPPGITAALGFGGLIPFYAFATPIAKHLPLDLVLEPSVLAQPGKSTSLQPSQQCDSTLRTVTIFAASSLFS